MSAEASGRTCRLTSIGRSDLDQQTQPARRDQPRIGGDHQHARVLAIQPKMVGADLAAAGGDQIGQGARAQRKQAFSVAQLRELVGAQSRLLPICRPRLIWDGPGGESRRPGSCMRRARRAAAARVPARATSSGAAARPPAGLRGGACAARSVQAGARPGRVRACSRRATEAETARDRRSARAIVRPRLRPNG